MDRRDPRLDARGRPDLPAARTTTSTRSRTSRSSSTTSRTPTRRPGSTSSWSSETGVGTVAAGVVQGTCRRRSDLRPRRRHRRGAADVAQARRWSRGRSAWPRRSRRCCSTAFGTGSSSSATASSRPVGTSWWRRCSAPRSSASPPPPWWWSGCILMRVCHLDTCPVGIATQNPELRARYTGKAEHVVRFFEYVARGGPELLAGLGLRSLDEAVGHAELLDARAATEHWKASGLDLAPLLHVPRSARRDVARRQTPEPGPRPRQGARQRADRAPAHRPSSGPSRSGSSLPIRNVNRTVGTMLGHQVTKADSRRAAGRHDRRHVHRAPPASRSARSCPRDHPARPRRRQRLRRQGAVGRPRRRTPRPARAVRRREQVIAGNVIGYGATVRLGFVRGPWASGSRCATPGRPSSSRGSVTTPAST